MTIEEALRKHEDHLMSLPGVHGVGIGRRGDRDIIKVFVDADAPRQDIPSSLEGYEVEVEVSEPFSALGAEPK